MAPIDFRVRDCRGHRVYDVPVILEGFEDEDEILERYYCILTPGSLLCLAEEDAGDDPWAVKGRWDAAQTVHAQDFSFWRITFCADKYFPPGSVPWRRICFDVSLHGRVQHQITLAFGRNNFSYELQHTSIEIFSIFGTRQNVNWTGLSHFDGEDNHESNSGSSIQDSDVDLLGPFSSEDDYVMEDEENEFLPAKEPQGLKRKASFSNELLPPKKRAR